MRVRLLALPLVALGAALLAPAALAATSPHFGSDGCDHSKPPAFGSKKPFFAKPGTVLKPGAKATIVMVTSCGTVRIKLAQDKTNPIPNSIAFLTTKHYFDGLSIFRAVPDFVLQAGSPFNNGTRGPGYTVDGPVPAGYQYKIGDVAMAKTQVDPSGTAGSQFFLITGPAGAQLQTDYGLLGHATDKASLATIRRLARFAVDPNPPSTPSKPLYIWTAKLVSG